ncbi:hypothetical protein Ocin01_16500 [Orchesella cincta]|uniref:Uncharacterized protein n=1 Tax=Orchesella cincta TaxID=48709 RepID=A0A1D2MBC3_ORCCI|nr:hypothetical protein Ocin01_16500 [Orchesella cincta]
MPFYLLISLLTLYAVQGFQVDVDTSQAPDLHDFGVKTKEILESWYPTIKRLLHSPEFKEVDRLQIHFDPSDTGVAGTDAFSNYIVGHAPYFRKHQDDFGAMIHEMTHVLQKYKDCDGWVTEGIADWVRYYQYEPHRQVVKKPSSEDSYTSGNPYFLEWINKNRYEHMIYFLNQDCRAGTYNINIFEKLTGKTVDELWQEMMADGRKNC